MELRLKVKRKLKKIRGFLRGVIGDKPPGRQNEG
jgi:hypothetical protein